MPAPVPKATTAPASRSAIDFKAIAESAAEAAEPPPAPSLSELEESEQPHDKASADKEGLEDDEGTAGGREGSAPAKKDRDVAKLDLQCSDSRRANGDADGGKGDVSAPDVPQDAELVAWGDAAEAAAKVDAPTPPDAARVTTGRNAVGIATEERSKSLDMAPISKSLVACDEILRSCLPDNDSDLLKAWRKYLTTSGDPEKKASRILNMMRCLHMQGFPGSAPAAKAAGAAGADDGNKASTPGQPLAAANVGAPTTAVAALSAGKPPDHRSGSGEKKLKKGQNKIALAPH